jgi:murein L,D-transpeptidase YcbB/YkuD
MALLLLLGIIMKAAHFLVIVAICLIMTTASPDIMSTPEPVDQILFNRAIGTERLYEIESLRQFYERNSTEGSWTIEKAKEMIKAIDMAATRGLNPDDYHKNAIQLLFDSRKNDAIVPFELDILLSDSFLHLAKHLHSGRTKSPATWQMKRTELSKVNLLIEALNGSELIATLYSVEPQSIQYAIMIETLRYYKTIAEKGGWAPIPGDRKLAIGSYGEDVEILCERLRMTDGCEKRDDPKLFDEHLHTAVQRFQERHGLQVDGIVGRSTSEELNIPVKKRINQLRINMERFRWISDNLGPRYIRINIPAYNLTVVEQGQELFTIRIIAGKSDWASPTFLSSDITYVETNPFWNVPAVIARKEIWPKVAKDPNYLERNQLKVIRRSDGSVMLRQQPGSSNSLGLIKIHFDNLNGCYLHDTPEKKLFLRPDRAFSHGCIRLEDAFGLASFLLLNNPDWDREKLENAANSGLRKTIYLSEPIPIFLLYFTAWPDSSGIIQFRKDVYNSDAALARGLESTSF